MVTLVDGLFGVGLLVSLGICVLGVGSYRRWDEPGITSFTGFALLFGLGGVAGGVGSLWVGLTAGQAPTWTQVALPALFLWTVPWALFGLQYTGRYTQVRWWAVLLAYVPNVGFLLLDVGLEELAGVEFRVLSQILGGTAFLYIFVLLALGIYLLVQTSYRYGHLSQLQGLSLVAAPITHFIVVNAANTTLGDTEGLTIAGMYVLGYALPGLAFLTALFRYDLFDSTPAIGEIGERAIARETDDLLVVVDDDDRIIKLNDSAVETLGLSRADALGKQLDAVFGNVAEQFEETQTVTLETTTGSRTYDAQVSTVTDQHDRELGNLLTLHDVTDRELREQRLSVLNRVLRHNLRNKIEVVRAHTERLDGDREHVEAILAATDDIVGLGKSARAIDQVVSEQAASSSVDIAATIQETVEGIVDTSTAVDLTVDTPENCTVVTNPTALSSALESAIENAVSYADSSVRIVAEQRPDGCLIRVVDDGPGIPQSELDSIQSGTETELQHGTGLGLWQLQWAVTTMGGDLSFDTDDGTTVEITVPDQRDTPDGQSRAV
jgi:PAS domain S-box-containing protein